MKNWEYNNEFTEDAKSLEQQAIENFTETILLAISSKQQASYKQTKMINNLIDDLIVLHREIKQYKDR